MIPSRPRSLAAALAAAALLASCGYDDSPYVAMDEPASDPGAPGGGSGVQPLVIGTAALPAGAAGQPYSETLAATGGTAPYSWTITSGALPEGLGLGLDGVISGTPVAIGTFQFTAQATDAAASPQSASRGLAITIAAAPVTPFSDGGPEEPLGATTGW